MSSYSKKVACKIILFQIREERIASLFICILCSQDEWKAKQADAEPSDEISSRFLRDLAKGRAEIHPRDPWQSPGIHINN